MPYFDKNRATHRVELSDGYWVLLRHLTVDESRELQKIEEDGPRGETGILMSILDWNCDDGNGNKAPIDKDWLGKMPARDFALVGEAFAKFEAIKTEARFPGEPGSSDTVQPGGAASPAEIPGAEGLVPAVGPTS